MSSVRRDCKDMQAGNRWCGHVFMSPINTERRPQTMSDESKDRKTIVYLSQSQRRFVEDEAIRLYREGEHQRQSVSEVVRRAVDLYRELYE